jgi:hypothetical protein
MIVQEGGLMSWLKVVTKARSEKRYHYSKPPFESIKPSFLDLFMKELARGRLLLREEDVPECQLNASFGCAVRATDVGMPEKDEVMKRRSVCTRVAGRVY